jgi:parvulin-like peptidyl-prolyl isomerase
MEETVNTAATEERRAAPGRRVAPAWAVLALCGAASLAPAEARAGEAGIVARVDGEPVTRAELKRAVADPVTLRRAQRLLGVERPEPGAVEALALRQVVRLRLLLQEARRRGIEISERELDAEIASLRRRFADLRGFGAWMQEQELDDRSLFDVVRDDLTADRVRSALVRDVTVAEAEVRRYYEAHAQEFGRTEVRLQLIAVEGEVAAQEIVAALEGGADFGRLARERSRGLRAARGGDTGWIVEEALAPPLRETVAASRPGQIRGPLRRGSDLLVARLQGRRRGAPRPFAEVSAGIERRLLAERREAALEAWLVDRERTSRTEVSRSALGEASGRLGAAAPPPGTQRR